MPAQRMLFVNVPVADLERSTAFFSALGFTFEPKFTDETATMMVVSDQASFMLLTRARFAEFTKRPVSDPATSTQAIFALSAEDRADVDRLADAALAAGAAPANEPMDHGFMYGRSFHDPDGHMWEVIWMTDEAAEQGPSAMDEAPSAA